MISPEVFWMDYDGTIQHHPTTFSFSFSSQAATAFDARRNPSATEMGHSHLGTHFAGRGDRGDRGVGPVDIVIFMAYSPV